MVEDRIRVLGLRWAPRVGLFVRSRQPPDAVVVAVRHPDPVIGVDRHARGTVHAARHAVAVVVPGQAAPERYSSQFKNRNVQRFRGGPVFKARRVLYPSTLGS